MKTCLFLMWTIFASVSVSQSQYNNLFAHLIQKQNPYNADVGRKVAITISIDGKPYPKKIQIGLFDSVTPITANNFYQLCVNQFFDNSPFHRVIPGFMIQGGDFTRGDGRGGHAFKYSENDKDKFDDENFLLNHEAFVLSMANAGPNTNGSQFFITLEKTKWLNGKHTVFGRVLKGKQVAKEIEKFGTRTGKTTKAIKMVKCEKIDEPKKKAPVASDGEKSENQSATLYKPKNYVHFDPISNKRKRIKRKFSQGIPIKFSSIKRRN